MNISINCGHCVKGPGYGAKGFRNRGIKNGTSLYVIKNTNSPAMLVELFFLDNQIDQTLYKKLGAKAIAQAIADAIV